MASDRPVGEAARHPVRGPESVRTQEAEPDADLSRVDWLDLSAIADSYDLPLWTPLRDGVALEVPDGE